MSVGLPTGLQRLRSERAAETLKRGWPEIPAWVFCSEAGTPLAPITYVAAQLGHTKPTTTLQWYAHWLPRGDKHWVDALDQRARRSRGSQLVANRLERMEASWK